MGHAMAHQSRVALVWLSLASWGAAGEGPQIAGAPRAAAWLAAARTAAAAALPVARPQSWAALTALSARAGALRAWACWALGPLQQHPHEFKLLCRAAHDEHASFAQLQGGAAGEEDPVSDPSTYEIPPAASPAVACVVRLSAAGLVLHFCLSFQRHCGSAAHFSCHVGIRGHADLGALSESRLEPLEKRHRLAWAQACCPAAALARHSQGVAAEPVAACLQHLDPSEIPVLFGDEAFAAAKASQVQGQLYDFIPVVMV